MKATVILQCWALALVAYAFLDEQCERWCRKRQCYVTTGKACSEIKQVHWQHLLYWLHEQFQAEVEPEAL